MPMIYEHNFLNDLFEESKIHLPKKNFAKFDFHSGKKISPTPPPPGGREISEMRSGSGKRSGTDAVFPAGIIPGKLGTRTINERGDSARQSLRTGNLSATRFRTRYSDAGNSEANERWSLFRRYSGILLGIIIILTFRINYGRENRVKDRSKIDFPGGRFIFSPPPLTSMNI